LKDQMRRGRAPPPRAGPRRTFIFAPSHARGKNANKSGREPLRCRWQMKQRRSVCSGRRETKAPRRRGYPPGTANGKAAFRCRRQPPYKKCKQIHPAAVPLCPQADEQCSPLLPDINHSPSRTLSLPRMGCFLLRIAAAIFAGFPDTAGAVSLRNLQRCGARRRETVPISIAAYQKEREKAEFSKTN